MRGNKPRVALAISHQQRHIAPRGEVVFVPPGGARATVAREFPLIGDPVDSGLVKTRTVDFRIDHIVHPVLFAIANEAELHADCCEQAW